MHLPHDLAFICLYIASISFWYLQVQPNSASAHINWGHHQEQYKDALEVRILAYHTGSTPIAPASNVAGGWSFAQESAVQGHASSAAGSA